MTAVPSPSSRVIDSSAMKPGPLVGVVLVDRAGEVDLAERLLQRLAHLADDDRREFVTPLTVQLGDGTDQLGPFGRCRRARPLTVRRRGRRDGGIQFGVCDRRILGHSLTGRRIGHHVVSHF
jgi:hypothetical protein